MPREIAVDHEESRNSNNNSRPLCKLMCDYCLSWLQVRRRSKACRAGLREYDELVAIGHHKCAELSHAEAMNLIDTQSGTLNLRVKRSEH